MSLENLLRILPVGVVSKNFIGLRRILRKSSSWSREEARSVPYGAECKVSRARGPRTQAGSVPPPQAVHSQNRRGAHGHGGRRRLTGKAGADGIQVIPVEATVSQRSSPLRMNLGQAGRSLTSQLGEQEQRPPLRTLTKTTPRTAFRISMTTMERA